MVANDDPRGQPSPMYRSTICTVEHSGERLLTVVQKDGLTSSRVQWIANARLISVAPELRSFVESVAKRDPTFAKGAAKLEIAAARELIAKADLP